MYSAFVIHDNDEDAGEREMATCFFCSSLGCLEGFFSLLVKKGACMTRT